MALSLRVPAALAAPEPPLHLLIRALALHCAAALLLPRGRIKIFRRMLPPHNDAAVASSSAPSSCHRRLRRLRPINAHMPMLACVCLIDVCCGPWLPSSGTTITLGGCTAPSLLNSAVSGCPADVTATTTTQTHMYNPRTFKQTHMLAPC